MLVGRMRTRRGRERARLSPGDEAQGVKVPLDDVDDLIALATRLMQKEEAPDSLTPEDVRRIGSELDIPERFVDEALATLGARRHEAQLARAAARRRRVAWGVAALALLGVGAVGAGSVHNGLQAQRAAAAGQQAQVRNVLQRRERVRERLAGAAPSRERDAELAGADNRISVEQRRYDTLASEYNAHAAAFPAVLVVRALGLPRALPLSTEVGAW